MDKMSRKDFLKGVGKTVAGVTVVGTISAALSGCAAPAAAAPATSEKPKWPFTYKKVDPDKAAERAFKAYKEKGG
ncbi:MAG: hypothetical protein ACM3TR_05425 [Caulobacteraceae bacterium]